MIEPKPPCRDCKNRTAENPELGTKDCHKSCALYQKYKEDHLEWSQIVFSQRMDELSNETTIRRRFQKYNKAKAKGLIK